jgi:hypothetical protein
MMCPQRPSPNADDFFQILLHVKPFRHLIHYLEMVNNRSLIYGNLELLNLVFFITCAQSMQGCNNLT